MARGCSTSACLSDFRKPFWRTAKHALRHGQIDGMLGAAFMGYHLIQFTREALRGDQNASYYSAKKRTSADGRRQAADAANRLRRRHRAPLRSPR